MDPSEYRGLDAVAIDRLVAKRQVTQTEVSDAANRSFADLDPLINAVVEWYEDPTRSRPLPAGRGSALRGVPLLRKDYGSAEAGRFVEMGSRLASGHRASSTAEFVKRIWSAGAQILGRSAVPEFIQHGTTESAVNGATCNPWDTGVSAGGSSGGAAAAVAAGVVPIAHASDCAGSIRIPAGACGLVGLKPGAGRVRWEHANDWSGLAQEFVVTRTVRDARRCLDLFAAGPYDPVVDQVRIAVNLDHWSGASLDEHVVRTAEAIARTLQETGHHVEPIGVPTDYEQLIGTWPALFNRPTLVDVQDLVSSTGRPANLSTLEPITLEAIAAARLLGPREIAAAEDDRTAIELRLEHSLAGYDVLLTPTLGRRTIPLDEVGGFVESLTEYAERNDALFPYNYLFNVTGWPAISVPGPVPPGEHPIGVQFSGRPGTEHLLLHLAAQIERALPWPLTAPSR